MQPPSPVCECGIEVVRGSVSPPFSLDGDVATGVMALYTSSVGFLSLRQHVLDRLVARVPRHVAAFQKAHTLCILVSPVRPPHTFLSEVVTRGIDYLFGLEDVVVGLVLSAVAKSDIHLHILPLIPRFVQLSWISYRHCSQSYPFPLLSRFVGQLILLLKLVWKQVSVLEQASSGDILVRMVALVHQGNCAVVINLQIA